MDDTFYQSPEFWVGVALVVFLVGVWRPASIAIMRWLDGERAKIRAELEDVRKLRAEAEATLASYQRKQQEALDSAEMLYRHAREESYRLRRQAADELTKMLALREKQGAERITQMEAAVIAELKQISVNASLATVEVLLHEKTDGKKSVQLVDQSIADLVRKAAA